MQPFHDYKLNVCEQNKSGWRFSKNPTALNYIKD